MTPNYDTATAVPGSPLWEGPRLWLLTELFDPASIRHLCDDIGVAQGWRALEVGAGAGSIAEWLGQAVGPAGHVLATDLDTEVLEQRDMPNVSVRRHDILTDQLPGEHFDVVYARFVLMGMPQRDHALRRMVTALRPGGWICIEDLSWKSHRSADEDVVYERVEQALREVRLAGGWDLDFGETVPARFERLGLVEVEAESWQSYSRSSHRPAGELHAMIIDSMRERLVATGSVSHADIDQAEGELFDPDFGMWSPTMWSAWAQKPVV